MFAGRSNLLRDPGTFSHLVIGERILSTGHFIYNDPFSFTFSGKPWIAQQWLGECLMAVIHRIGGFDSLLLFTVTLLASLYTWLILRLMRKGMHPMLAILIIAMAMAASSFHFHVRPHLVTIIFSAVLFAVLTDFESGQIRLSRLFWLIPLFALWVNIHGGVLGGMATLAITGTGWILIRLVKKSPPLLTFQQIFSLILLILACLSTAFVNPYGLALPKTWFLIMNSPLLPQVIQEHAPLFSSGVFYAVLPFALLYFICLLGTLPGWPRITWLIPAVWFCLALMRVRHAPLFAVFAAIAIGDMFPHVRWVKWLSDRGSEIVKIQNTPIFNRHKKLNRSLIFIPILLMIIGFTCQRADWPIPLLGRGWAKLDSRHWPIEVLPGLLQIQQANPEGTPIFNEFLFGGFLMYYTPGLRVFIDDRCELYGDDFIKKYLEAESSQPEQFSRWVNQYPFDYALTIRGSGFDSQFSRSLEWAVMSSSKTAVLYKKL